MVLNLHPPKKIMQRKTILVILTCVVTLFMFGCTGLLKNKVTIRTDIPLNSSYDGIGLFDKDKCILYEQPDDEFTAFTVDNCQNINLVNQTTYKVSGDVCGYKEVNTGMHFGTLKNTGLAKELLLKQKTIADEILFDESIDKDAEVWVEIPVICAKQIEPVSFYTLVINNDARFEGAKKEDESILYTRSPIKCTNKTAIILKCPTNCDEEKDKVFANLSNTSGFIRADGYQRIDDDNFYMIYFNDETFTATDVAGYAEINKMVLFSKDDHKIVSIPIMLHNEREGGYFTVDVYIHTKDGLKDCSYKRGGNETVGICEVNSSLTLNDIDSVIMLGSYSYEALSCFSKFSLE